jgi:hypothetical protein
MSAVCALGREFGMGFTNPIYITCFPLVSYLHTSSYFLVDLVIIVPVQEGDFPSSELYYFGRNKHYIVLSSRWR